MIKSEILEEFSSKLAENTNILAIPKSVFSMMAEQYDISELDSVYSVDHTEFTQNGEKGNVVLYKDGRSHEVNPSFSARYATDEGGEVSFVFYFMDKDLPDDETKTDLKILSDIMFIECGRWRLAGKLKTAYMTDGLTGLANTGGYIANAEKLAKRGELKNYNSFYFNLSHFGLVNLRFGNNEANTIIKSADCKINLDI